MVLHAPVDDEGDDAHHHHESGGVAERAQVELKDVQPAVLVLLHSVLVSEEVEIVALLRHTVVVAVAAGEDGVHQLKPRDADGAGRSGQSLATETA